MYPNYRHEDDTTCAYCGVETEVIGPPGPVHKPGCPHAPDPFLSKNERNLTDEESDFLFEQTIGTPVGRNLLRKMLDNRKKK